MDEEKNEWREKVDSVILYDRLDELRSRLREIERVLLVGKDSLRSEYRRHDQDLARINAVLFQDPTGQKGLLHDVDVLMGRRRDKDETRGLRWQSWTAIIVAMISSIALILSNLDKLKTFLPKEHPDLLEQRIEQAKHPRSKKKIYIYHRLPAKVTEDPEDPLQE